MADQRYKIYEQLGAGGNGAVFRAYDTQLKRWVAIKRLISASEISTDDPTVAELRREADTLASMRNANIVTIFDVSSDEEGLFIVMELLEGPDLADATQHGPLALDDFKQLAEQTLEALLAAHQLRILHRDLKPENIKVERLPGGRFQAKIIDFGLARSGLGARKQTEDQAGSVMGSIYYMAPEQLSREPTDGRTDIYSLGCVFYEALSARKAFDGKSVGEVIDKHLDHDVVSLDVLCPHLPQWLTYWVMRLMARKPDDRPASAQQAIEEYRAWEKLPPAPNMMPWMPMNYGYGYGQQPAVAYGTGTVPLHTTGYYAPPHITSSSVPVQPYEGQEVMYAHAVPQAEPYALPIVEPVKSKGKLFAIIGGVVILLAAGGGYYFWKGGAKPPTPASTAPAGPATIDVGPPRENMFPSDRAYPPPEQMRVVHFIAKTATRGYSGKSVPAKNDGNSPVSVWDDLTKRGDNTPLVSLGTNPDTSPQRVKWANPDGMLKPDRYVLDFTSRSSKTVSMRLYQAEKQKDFFPFGNPTPSFPAGFTIGIVFQPGGQLPCRVLRLQSADGASSVTLRVLANKNIEAEFKDGAGDVKLTSANIDGTKPCTVTLVWSAETNEVVLRTHDARGGGNRMAGKLPIPQVPLYDLQLGGVVNTLDQFNGQIAECAVFATPIRDDQCSLWEKDLRDQYFATGPSKPLKDRLITKLPVIDNTAKTWKLTASITKDNPAQAADGNVNSRWSTSGPMTPGNWFQIELPAQTDLGGLVLDASLPNDYPQHYKVDISLDGKAWAKVTEDDGKVAPTEIIFPGAKKGRFIRITQTGTSSNYWSIDEVVLLKPE